jgi:hypothetical protein
MPRTYDITTVLNEQARDLRNDSKTELLEKKGTSFNKKPLHFATKRQTREASTSKMRTAWIVARKKKTEELSEAISYKMTRGSDDGSTSRTRSSSSSSKTR